MTRLTCLPELSALSALSDRLRRATLALALPIALALSGCATPQPPAVAPLLDDALFDHPLRPTETDAAMALDPAMRRYLATHLQQGAQRKGKARALADALYQGPDGLMLDYDATVTRTAALAFAARSGNCLSLVLMTAAFARELGLEVTFQHVPVSDAYARLADLNLRIDHVNLVLGPPALSAASRGSGFGADPSRLQIDFLPPAELKGLRTLAIAEHTVLAMFMNNRATEALGRGEPAEAYAWSREALLRHPAFTPAVNTLGLVYQRAGHLDAAARAYETVLLRDPRQVASLWNLAQVRQAQGRPEEARRWTEQRLAIEPGAPFEALQGAEAAMARGEWTLAQRLLPNERRVTGDTHELHFALARLNFSQGRNVLAQRELQQAIARSPSASLQALYAGKLAWLRAQGAL